MLIDWRHWDWNVHVEGAGDSHWSSPQAAGLTDAHTHTITQRSGGSAAIKTVDICESLRERIFLNRSFLLPRCPLKQKPQALPGTQTTSTPTSSHMSRCRSCLFQSEQSASSLSQSEGIQSTSGAECQAGCCRGSSRSTDTVDSAALFMGTAGAYEMASHSGLHFYSPQLYCGWCDARHLQQLLIVSKNDNTRNAKGQGTWKAGLTEERLSEGKLNICRFSTGVWHNSSKSTFRTVFWVTGKKENTCSRTKIAPLWKIKYILWLSCQLLSFAIKSINTDHKVNMKTRSI